MPPTCRKLNNSLGHVREQLKSGKTRGAHPRDLSAEEVQALEARRDQLQAEMLEAQRKRVVAQVNAHTSGGEAEQTREAVRSEGQQTRAAVSAELRPLTSLVAGADSEDLAERVKARRNQIALLRTCIREDLHAARKEREAAKEARAAARAESTGRGRKRSRQLSQAGREGWWKPGSLTKRTNQTQQRRRQTMKSKASDQAQTEKWQRVTRTRRAMWHNRAPSRPCQRVTSTRQATCPWSTGRRRRRVEKRKTLWALKSSSWTTRPMPTTSASL